MCIYFPGDCQRQCKALRVVVLHGGHLQYCSKNCAGLSNQNMRCKKNKAPTLEHRYNGSAGLSIDEEFI